MAAQKPDSVHVPTGRFVGTIINSVDSAPVRSVDIRLLYLDSSRTVRTARGDSLELFIDSTRSRLAVSDSAGRFAVRRLEEGRFLLNIRRIGFAPLQGVVNADTGAIGDVFALVPTSPLLAKVVITEMGTDRVTQRLERTGFRDRAHSGSSGTFVKREDILRLKRDNIGDVLAAYGIHSGDVVLDRMPLEYEEVLSYPADLIVGIEIYRRSRPTEFNMTTQGPNILSLDPQANVVRPLILIWTFIP